MKLRITYKYEKVSAFRAGTFYVTGISLDDNIKERFKIRGDDMDTKDIECFETVYSERSMNRAAKKLFITPQGLGKIIRKLEAELGTSFFERTQKGLVPTQAAHLFHERAHQLSKQLERMAEEMKQFANQDKVLRIGCANGIFHVLPLKMLQEFTKQNPDMKVEWNEYENDIIVEKLLESKLDYGCIVGEAKDIRLTQRVLSRSRIVLLVYKGHPLYHAEYVTLDMLRGEKILTMNERFRIYHDLIRACRIRGFVPDITAKTMDGGVLIHLCTQKMGLAVTPDFETENYREMVVRAIPFQDFHTWDVCGAYLTEKKNFENIRIFDEFLCSISGQSLRPKKR